MSNSVIAIIRAIHIGFGAFWIGGALTAGFFLLPAIKAGASHGRQLAAQILASTRVLAAITVSGVIAILAGGILYRGIWAGGGFYGPAVWYAMGSHFAIVALILTGAVVLPAMHKLRKLTGAEASHESPAVAAQNFHRERLIKRITVFTQISAALLIPTVVFMAIGRYV